MRTETRKAFKHGFVLTEQELRRMMDTTMQQVERIAPLKPPRVRIDVKFKNGTIARATDLEDVLSFENIGAKQIIRFDASVRGRAESGEFLIVFNFTNLKAEEYDVHSIHYVVRAEKRDWVFVTSSELEDRIGRIRTPRWTSFFRTLRPRIFFLFMLILLGSMVGMIFASTTPSMDVATKLEDRWKAGTLRDPIEALIIMQKEAESRMHSAPRLMVRWAVLYPVTLGCGLALCSLLAGYLYPPYVFCWADYAKIYEKRVGARKLVFGTILGGLVISVLAGIIVNRGGWGR